MLDEDVETPEIAPDPVHALLDALVPGNVELPCFDGKMCGNQFPGGTKTFGGVPRAKDDADAELRELPTGLEANSTVASRHEGDLLFSHFSFPSSTQVLTE